MEKKLDLYSIAKVLSNDSLRELIRCGDFKYQTAGLSKNMLQTNLIILEKNYALDFMIFCQRNPKACPLVGVTDLGNPFFKTLGETLMLEQICHLIIYIKMVCCLIQFKKLLDTGIRV